MKILFWKWGWNLFLTTQCALETFPLTLCYATCSNGKWCSTRHAQAAYHVLLAFPWGPSVFVSLPVPALMLNSCSIHHWWRCTLRRAARWTSRSGLVDWQTCCEPVFSAEAGFWNVGERRGFIRHDVCLRPCCHTRGLFLVIVRQSCVTFHGVHCWIDGLWIITVYCDKYCSCDKIKSVSSRADTI